VYDILLDFEIFQRFCWLVSPAYLWFLKDPEIRAPVYPRFLLALRWSGTTCPSYFAYLRPLRSFFAVGTQGPRLAPILCCSGLSSPAVAVFLSKFVGSYLLAFWGVSGLCDRQIHNALGSYSAYSASFTFRYSGGFCLWKTSSLLLSWLVSASFWLQWQVGSAESWRFELSSL